jgi:hypothetical protein
MSFWMASATCGPALGPVLAGFSIAAEKYLPCLISRSHLQLEMVIMGDALALRSGMDPLLTGNLGLKYSSPSRLAASQINRERSPRSQSEIDQSHLSFHEVLVNSHTRSNRSLRAGCCIHQRLFRSRLWHLLFLFRSFSSCLSFAVWVQSWTVGSRVHVHYCSCEAKQCVNTYGNIDNRFSEESSFFLFFLPFFSTWKVLGNLDGKIGWDHTTIY